jgi:REP element-mobilizing transposase RayT
MRHAIPPVGGQVEIAPWRHREFAASGRMPLPYDWNGRLPRHVAGRLIEPIAVCADFEVALKEFNGEPDHVHLLVNYPPKVRLSELVNSLKGVSSRQTKQEFPAIATFWSVKKSHGALWPASYFAGSVGGAPISILRQYIEDQEKPPEAAAL